MDPAYLLPSEVAAMLRLSVKSVYRLAASDATLPQLRVMGSLRFPRERLLRWLYSREGGRLQRRPTVPSSRAAVHPDSGGA